MPQGTTNLLLASLSASSRDLLLSRGTAVTLPLKTTLYDADATPRYAYFITSGMASVVTSMPDGASAEVGVIGCEGIVGGVHLLGPTKIATNAFMQIAGTGLRIPFHELQQAYLSKSDIRDRILEDVQAQFVLASQLAGCNRLHDADSRFARWLLMCQDRTGSDLLGLTQDFLAMMLGAMRTTVSVIAGKVQREGMIEYRRGNVRILDRTRLEAAACDCYPIMQKTHAALYSKPLVSEIELVNLSSVPSNGLVQTH